ncbi:hypothetical protein Esti_002848 [Eimeria stiedai]
MFLNCCRTYKATKKQASGSVHTQLARSCSLTAAFTSSYTCEAQLSGRRQNRQRPRGRSEDARRQHAWPTVLQHENTMEQQPEEQASAEAPCETPKKNPYSGTQSARSDVTDTTLTQQQLLARRADLYLVEGSLDQQERQQQQQQPVQQQSGDLIENRGPHGSLQHAKESIHAQQHTQQQNQRRRPSDQSEQRQQQQQQPPQRVGTHGFSVTREDHQQRLQRQSVRLLQQELPAADLLELQQVQREIEAVQRILQSSAPTGQGHGELQQSSRWQSNRHEQQPTDQQKHLQQQQQPCRGRPVHPQLHRETTHLWSTLQREAHPTTPDEHALRVRRLDMQRQRQQQQQDKRQQGQQLLHSPRTKSTQEEQEGKQEKQRYHKDPWNQPIEVVLNLAQSLPQPQQGQQQQQQRQPRRRQPRSMEQAGLPELRQGCVSEEEKRLLTGFVLQQRLLAEEQARQKEQQQHQERQQPQKGLTELQEEHGKQMQKLAAMQQEQRRRSSMLSRAEQRSQQQRHKQQQEELEHVQLLQVEQLFKKQKEQHHQEEQELLMRLVGRGEQQQEQALTSGQQQRQSQFLRPVHEPHVNDDEVHAVLQQQILMLHEEEQVLIEVERDREKEWQKARQKYREQRLAAGLPLPVERPKQQRSLNLDDNEHLGGLNQLQQLRVEADREREESERHRQQREQQEGPQKQQQSAREQLKQLLQQQQQQINVRHDQIKQERGLEGLRGRQLQEQLRNEGQDDQQQQQQQESSQQRQQEGRPLAQRMRQQQSQPDPGSTVQEAQLPWDSREISTPAARGPGLSQQQRQPDLPQSREEQQRMHFSQGASLTHLRLQQGQAEDGQQTDGLLEELLFSRTQIQQRPRAAAEQPLQQQLLQLQWPLHDLHQEKQQPLPLQLLQQQESQQSDVAQHQGRMQQQPTSEDGLTHQLQPQHEQLLPPRRDEQQLQQQRDVLHQQQQHSAAAAIRSPRQRRQQQHAGQPQQHAEQKQRSLQQEQRLQRRQRQRLLQRKQQQELQQQVARQELQQQELQEHKNEQELLQRLQQGLQRPLPQQSGQMQQQQWQQPVQQRQQLQELRLEPQVELQQLLQLQQHLALQQQQRQQQPSTQEEQQPQQPRLEPLTPHASSEEQQRCQQQLHQLQQLLQGVDPCPILQAEATDMALQHKPQDEQQLQQPTRTDLPPALPSEQAGPPQPQQQEQAPVRRRRSAQQQEAYNQRRQQQRREARMLQRQQQQEDQQGQQRQQEAQQQEQQPQHQSQGPQPQETRQQRQQHSHSESELQLEHEQQQQRGLQQEGQWQQEQQRPPEQQPGQERECLHEQTLQEQKQLLERQAEQDELLQQQQLKDQQQHWERQQEEQKRQQEQRRQEEHQCQQEQQRGWQRLQLQQQEHHKAVLQLQQQLFSGEVPHDLQEKTEMLKARQRELQELQTRQMHQQQVWELQKQHAEQCRLFKEQQQKHLLLPLNAEHRQKTLEINAQMLGMLNEHHKTQLAKLHRLQQEELRMQQQQQMAGPPRQLLQLVALQQEQQQREETAQAEVLQQQQDRLQPRQRQTSASHPRGNLHEHELLRYELQQQQLQQQQHLQQLQLHDQLHQQCQQQHQEEQHQQQHVPQHDQMQANEHEQHLQVGEPEPQEVKQQNQLQQTEQEQHQQEQRHRERPQLQGDMHQTGCVQQDDEQQQQQTSNLRQEDEVEAAAMRVLMRLQAAGRQMQAQQYAVQWHLKQQQAQLEQQQAQLEQQHPPQPPHQHSVSSPQNEKLAAKKRKVMSCLHRLMSHHEVLNKKRDDLLDMAEHQLNVAANNNTSSSSNGHCAACSALEAPQQPTEEGCLDAGDKADGDKEERATAEGENNEDDRTKRINCEAAKVKKEKCPCPNAEASPTIDPSAATATPAAGEAAAAKSVSLPSAAEGSSPIFTPACSPYASSGLASPLPLGGRGAPLEGLSFQSPNYVEELWTLLEQSDACASLPQLDFEPFMGLVPLLEPLEEQADTIRELKLQQQQQAILLEAMRSLAEHTEEMLSQYPEFLVHVAAFRQQNMDRKMQARMREGCHGLKQVVSRLAGDVRSCMQPTDASPVGKSLAALETRGGWGSSLDDTQGDPGSDRGLFTPLSRFLPAGYDLSAGGSPPWVAREIQRPAEQRVRPASREETSYLAPLHSTVNSIRPITTTEETLNIEDDGFCLAGASGSFGQLAASYFPTDPLMHPPSPGSAERREPLREAIEGDTGGSGCHHHPLLEDLLLIQPQAPWEQQQQHEHSLKQQAVEDITYRLPANPQRGRGTRMQGRPRGRGRRGARGATKAALATTRGIAISSAWEEQQQQQQQQQLAYSEICRLKHLQRHQSWRGDFEFSSYSPPPAVHNLPQRRVVVREGRFLTSPDRGGEPLSLYAWRNRRQLCADTDEDMDDMPFPASLIVGGEDGPEERSPAALAFADNAAAAAAASATAVAATEIEARKKDTERQQPACLSQSLAKLLLHPLPSSASLAATVTLSDRFIKTEDTPPLPCAHSHVAQDSRAASSALRARRRYPAAYVYQQRQQQHREEEEQQQQRGITGTSSSEPCGATSEALPQAERPGHTRVSERQKTLLGGLALLMRPMNPEAADDPHQHKMPFAFSEQKFGEIFFAAPHSPLQRRVHPETAAVAAASAGGAIPPQSPATRRRRRESWASAGDREWTPPRKKRGNTE